MSAGSFAQRRPRMSRVLFVSLVHMLALEAGCARDPRSTPEDALASWVSAMQASRSDLGARRHAFELLSAHARASLGERAARASQLSGREIQPWEMLAPGRFAMRFAFDRTALRTRIQGEHATVTVFGPAGEYADVPMVREDGRWRVDLDLPPMQPVRSDGDGGA